MGFPRLLRLCVGFLVLTIAGAASQTAAQKPMFRTNAEMVLVPVTVTDRNGKTIDGLRADDFKVFDDKRSQKIASFAVEDAPCSVGLVLDISGSMESTLRQTKDIAHAFFEASNPDDEFLLLTVSTEPAATARFTTDTAALEESIAFAPTGGLTALIDTVYLGLGSMKKAELPRRALLIISDGKDNHSRYSESELMSVALEADIQIYTIIMDTGSGGLSSSSAPYRPSMVAKPWDRAAENRGPEMLEKLSDQTGGLHFRVHDNADAKEAVMKIGRALRDEYVIGYRPQDLDKSRKWHRIRVKLNTTGKHVHARTGYYSE